LKSNPDLLHHRLMQATSRIQSPFHERL
jgi:hypothetical protein